MVQCTVYMNICIYNIRTYCNIRSSMIPNDAKKTKALIGIFVPNSMPTLWNKLRSAELNQMKQITDGTMPYKTVEQYAPANLVAGTNISVAHRAMMSGIVSEATYAIFFVFDVVFVDVLLLFVFVN